MTVSLVIQKAEVRKYSEAQPRDDHGRWTGGYIGVPASAAKPGEEPGINGRVSQPSGSPVRGKVISPDDPRIGPYVYHVSSNGQQVQESGVLKAGGVGGLGGDWQDRIVSFTIDPKIADQLQQDMRMVTNLSNALPAEPDHPTWNDETKQWDDTANHADWSRQLVPLLQDEARRQGVDWSEGARMSTMDFLLKDYGLNEWTNSFFNARELQTKTPNPLFFGLKQSDWQGKDPSDIKVFAVPRDNLKTGALLTNFDLGNPYGLQEVRSYGDVPIAGAVIKYDPEQARDEHGRWSTGGGGGKLIDPSDMAAMHALFPGQTSKLADSGESQKGWLWPDGSFLPIFGESHGELIENTPELRAAFFAASASGEETDEWSWPQLEGGWVRVNGNAFEMTYTNPTEKQVSEIQQAVLQRSLRDPTASFYFDGMDHNLSVTREQVIRAGGLGPLLDHAGVVQKYDPSQPRDEHGQWTSGGSDPFNIPAVSSKRIPMSTEEKQKFLPMTKPSPEAHVTISRRDAQWLTEHASDNPELMRVFQDYRAGQDLTRSQYDGLRQMIGSDLNPEDHASESSPSENVQQEVPPAALAKFGAMTAAFEQAGGTIVPIDESNYEKVMEDFAAARDRVDGDREPTQMPDPGIRLMNAALAGGPFEPDVVTNLAAYDKTGNLVGAMLGEHGSSDNGSYVHVAAIGSTREVAGAGTALEHEMAKVAAGENAYIYGEPLWAAVPYHVSIGRAPLDPDTGEHVPGELTGNSPGGWTADEIQQVAKAA